MKTQLLSAGMSSVVEQQMRNWELAKSQHLDDGPVLPAENTDFICLTREFGTNADQIAALVAEKLGWPFFDREIIHAMAGNDALRELVYASMDEREIGYFEELLHSFLDPGSFRGDYFHELTHTIRSIARQCSAVFVGHGADMILPPDAGLRVDIVAPMEMRIRNAAERLQIPWEQARREIERLEKERAAYLRRHFPRGKRVSRPYDLVINLRRLSIAAAADLIVAARSALRRQDVATAPS